MEIVSCHIKFGTNKCFAQLWKVQVNYLNILSLYKIIGLLFGRQFSFTWAYDKLKCLHANLKRF